MKGYEGFVAAANAATRERNQAIVDRQLEHGKLEGFTLEEKIALNETIEERGAVRQHNIDLYGVEGCQFLLKNFMVRFIERKEEIDSLTEAEAILGAGGGDPKMAAATGQNAPSEDDGGEGVVGDVDKNPVPDGVEIKADAVRHFSQQQKLHAERATVHMDSGKGGCI